MLPSFKSLLFQLSAKFTEGGTSDDEEIGRDGEILFEEMLRYAVKFCNVETDTNRKIHLQELKTWYVKLLSSISSLLKRVKPTAA